MSIITKRVYVPEYSYTRRFNVKPKAAKKPAKAGTKRRGTKKPYNFAVPSTGRRVAF